MSNPELFFYHLHTEESNHHSRVYAGEESAENHGIDIVETVKNLPPGTNAVFATTEHFKAFPAKDPRSRYSQMEDKIFELKYKGYDASIELFDRHAYGYIGESEFADINCVEASLEDDIFEHITICGVPIDEENEMAGLSLDEHKDQNLYEKARNASWIGPAHPHLDWPKDFGIRENRFNSIIEEGRKDYDIELVMNYTTGFNLPTNKIARGEWGKDESVSEVAGDEIPLIPELDAHVKLPGKLDGAGVVYDTMDEFSDGRIPVERIIEAEIIDLPNRIPGINSWDFVRTMAPDSLPGYESGLYRFTDNLPEPWKVPYQRENFEEIAEKDREKLSELDPDYLFRNTRPL